MRNLLFLLLLFICSTYVSAQKTAQDYFNQSASLYVNDKKEEALQLVNRGIEVFDTDSLLLNLKKIIEGKKDNKDENQDKKQNNDSNKDNQNDDSGNGNKNNQDQKNQDSSQDKNKKSESGNQKNDQNQKQAQSGQNKGNEEKGDQKGKISKMEAEMMLKSIENDEKAVQMRVQQQKKQKIQQQRIEKEW